MRIILVAAFALAFVAATAPAKALSKQDVESVQTAIKAAECTVDDTQIKPKPDGYKANDAQCKDGMYDILLDKNFNITKKEKEGNGAATEGEGN